MKICIRSNFHALHLSFLVAFSINVNNDCFQRYDTMVTCQLLYFMWDKLVNSWPQDTDMCTSACWWVNNVFVNFSFRTKEELCTWQHQQCVGHFPIPCRSKTLGCLLKFRMNLEEFIYYQWKLCFISFLWCILYCFSFVLYCTYDWNHSVFVFFWLIYSTEHHAPRSVHFVTMGVFHLFFFMVK